MIVSLFRVLALLAAAMITGCTHAPYYSGTSVGVRGHYDGAYDDFYFYPDVSVYFSILSGHYYHRSHHRWIRADTLPRHIRLNPRQRVKLRLHRERPYLHHQDHRARFGMHRSRDHDWGPRQESRLNPRGQRDSERRDRSREQHRRTGRSRRDVFDQSHQRAISAPPRRRDADRIPRDRRQTYQTRAEQNERPRQRRGHAAADQRSTDQHGRRRHGLAPEQRSGTRSESGARSIDRARTGEWYSSRDRTRSNERRMRRRDRERNVVNNHKRRDVDANDRRIPQNTNRPSNTQRSQDRARRSHSRATLNGRRDGLQDRPRRSSN